MPRHREGYFTPQENEAWRGYEQHQDEADAYKEKVDRFQQANQYLWDREHLRDVDPQGNPQDQERFSGNPSRWFRGGQ